MVRLPKSAKTRNLPFSVRITAASLRLYPCQPEGTPSALSLNVPLGTTFVSGGVEGFGADIVGFTLGATVGVGVTLTLGAREGVAEGETLGRVEGFGLGVFVHPTAMHEKIMQSARIRTEIFFITVC